MSSDEVRHHGAKLLSVVFSNILKLSSSLPAQQHTQITCQFSNIRYSTITVPLKLWQEAIAQHTDHDHSPNIQGSLTQHNRKQYDTPVPGTNLPDTVRLVLLLVCATACATLGNPSDTIKSFCPYSQCSHLNLLTIFPLRVDAQEI